MGTGLALQGAESTEKLAMIDMRLEIDLTILSSKGESCSQSIA